MKIGFAQINPTVGDLTGNFEKIAAAYDRLVAAGAELVITPELAITGYPPQDLVFKSRFVPQNIEIVEQLHARVTTAPLLVGFVDRNEGRGKPFHNSAALLTGALYNLVAYRTKSLGACVLAHAVTNLLLGLWIMSTRQWGFW